MTRTKRVSRSSRLTAATITCIKYRTNPPSSSSSLSSSSPADATASPSDVSVHVDPPPPPLPASSAPPLLFVAPFYLPLPTNQFIALIILGCLASAICRSPSPSLP
jgi:hypothetical protein